MVKISTLPTPDAFVWPLGPSINKAEIISRHIKVNWANGKSNVFHSMWLRDNCPCNECVHPHTREQIIDLLDIPNDISAVKVKINSDGGLWVKWNHAQHCSLFNPGWLYAHSGHLENQLPERVLWTSQDLPQPPTFDGPRVMRNPKELYRVLKAVHIFGIARLKSLPTELNTVEQAALKIGPIRETHFERIFNVLSKPDADSNAYTSSELSTHTDIPTRETPPGLQLLHCIVADAPGGESVMVDGFRVAEDIRKEKPDVFQNLTTVKWTFANRAGESDFRWASPPFVLDDSGKLKEVRLVSFSRDPLIEDFQKIDESYQALRTVLHMTNLEHYRMVFPFEPGDLVIFDNRRILHGRTSFDPSAGARHLQGTYVDRDDHLSTMRSIIHRQHKKLVNA